jgi:hypothetical protein
LEDAAQADGLDHWRTYWLVSRPTPARCSPPSERPK